MVKSDARREIIKMVEISNITTEDLIQLGGIPYYWDCLDSNTAGIETVTNKAHVQQVIEFGFCYIYEDYTIDVTLKHCKYDTKHTVYLDNETKQEIPNIVNCSANPSATSQITDFRKTIYNVTNLINGHRNKNMSLYDRYLSLDSKYAPVITGTAIITHNIKEEKLTMLEYLVLRNIVDQLPIQEFSSIDVLQENAIFTLPYKKKTKDEFYYISNLYTYPTN